MNVISQLPEKLSHEILHYIASVQCFEPGEYYGAFWSEKAYHGPLLDWHAGGAYHYRGCSAASLCLWLDGCVSGNLEQCHRAELGFDWLTAGQHSRGGWYEFQNNQKPSDWENTGLEELSTIESSFAVHGLCEALLRGLPPKKSYMETLLRAGHWFLSIEFPPGSGVFPHHERSPYDTLNANLHAAEALAAIYRVMRNVYKRNLHLFLQGARRAVEHTLSLQWENGCMPYRNYGFSTVNYTSLVLWCLMNIMDGLPDYAVPPVYWMDREVCCEGIRRACSFLRSAVQEDGSLNWEEFETSTARHNLWCYFLTANVLFRQDPEDPALRRMLGFIASQVAGNGLPRMRDTGEEVTDCAYMQAEILMFLLPFCHYSTV